MAPGPAGSVREIAHGLFTFLLSMARESVHKPYQLPASELSRMNWVASAVSASLDVFSNPIRSRLLVYLLEMPHLTQVELSTLAQCHPSTVAHYVKYMEQTGWVEIQRRGRSKRLAITSERRPTVEFLTHAFGTHRHPS